MLANIWKRKYADFWLLLTRWLCWVLLTINKTLNLFPKDSFTNRYVLHREWHSPTQHSIYFPKDCWWILKQSNLFIVFTALVSAFGKFHWMFLFLKIYLFVLSFKGSVFQSFLCTAICDFYNLFDLNLKNFNYVFISFKDSLFVKFVKSWPGKLRLFFKKLETHMRVLIKMNFSIYGTCTLKIVVLPDIVFIY